MYTTIQDNTDPKERDKYGTATQQFGLQKTAEFKWQAILTIQNMSLQIQNLEMRSLVLP